MKYKHILLIVLISLIMTLPTFTTASHNISEEKEVKLPILTVTKLSDKRTVSVGESFQVIIIIKNIGNSTAYNITLSDSKPSNWGASVNGLLKRSWSELPPGAEIIHSYNMSIEATSNFLVHLGRAKITYYDNNSNKYVIYSEDLSIYVQVKSGINIDWDKIWRDVILMESILVLLIIIPLMLIEYNLYRNYKREISEKG